MTDKKETGLATRKTREVSTEVNEETLALLRESYPVEQGANRIFLPRLGMVSQDKTEESGTGKNKKIVVVAAAGEFFIEKQTEEVDEETGKKKWERTDLGTSIEGIILFQRKQLKMYDEKAGTYTSSPIYDKEDEILPLFCDKAEVGRGTPAELQAKYQYTDKDNKVKSKLEIQRVLYIKYEGEIYQMNLRGSSMYSFLTYARKTLANAVVTEFGSESKENGQVAWNMMTFAAKRKLTQTEAEEVVATCQEIKQAIDSEKAQYATNVISVEVIKAGDAAEEKFNNF